MNRSHFNLYQQMVVNSAKMGEEYYYEQ